MGDIAKFSLLGTVGRITVGGLAGLGAMTAALAAPTADHHGAPVKSGLDLRPAKVAVDAVPSKSAGAGFPSALHRHILERQEEIDLPSMGSGNTQERIQSRAEVFARRVHREGLPLRASGKTMRRFLAWD